MATDVGQLMVEVGADIGDLQTGLKKAGAEVGKFGDNMSKSLSDLGGKLSSVGGTLTKGLTLPLVAAGAGLVGLAMKAGATAEEILNLKTQTGLSTDTLQELKYTTDQVGVSFDTVKNGFAMVQAKLQGVENDSGAASDAFKRLGIEAKGSDGSLRAMSDLIPEMLSRLQGITNETERNMLAAQLFGKGWKEIAPLLSLSKAEMAAFAAEAKNMGLVMDEASLKQAAEFDDAMGRLKASFAGAATQIATTLIPLLQKDLIPFIQETVIPAIKSFAEKLGELIRWFNGLPDPMKNFILILAGIAIAAGPVLQALGGIAQGIGAIIKIAPALAGIPSMFAGIGGAASAAGGAVGGLGGALGALVAAAPWIAIVAGLALIAFEIAGIFKYRAEAKRNEEIGRQMDAQNLPKIAAANKQAQANAAKAKAAGYASMGDLRAKAQAGDARARQVYSGIYGANSQTVQGWNAQRAAAPTMPAMPQMAMPTGLPSMPSIPSTPAYAPAPMMGAINITIAGDAAKLMQWVANTADQRINLKLNQELRGVMQGA